jgi:2-iminobutanoate/2-iminopropanoate deaminase
MKIQDNEVIGMPNVVPHFSPSRRAGDLVFVSGQMAFGPDRQIVSGGVREQTQRCIANIGAILAQSGLTLAHVVKSTVWLARVRDFAEFNDTYALAFSGVPPARSTVRADLMLAEALVEIEVIAQVPPDGTGIG